MILKLWKGNSPRKPRRVVTLKEHLEKLQMKNKIWCEDQLHEWARTDPEIRRQVLSHHAGFELKPMSEEQRFHEDLWRLMRSRMPEVFDRNPRFALRYIAKVVKDTAGIDLEEASVGSGLQDKRRADSARAFAEQYKALKKLVGARRTQPTKGVELMNGFVALLNTPFMTEIGKGLGARLAGNPPPPPQEQQLRFLVGGKWVTVSESEYQGLVKVGLAQPISGGPLNALASGAGEIKMMELLPKPPSERNNGSNGAGQAGLEKGKQASRDGDAGGQ